MWNLIQKEIKENLEVEEETIIKWRIENLDIDRLENLLLYLNDTNFFDVDFTEEKNELVNLNFSIFNQTTDLLEVAKLYGFQLTESIKSNPNAIVNLMNTFVITNKQLQSKELNWLEKYYNIYSICKTFVFQPKAKYSDSDLLIKSLIQDLDDDIHF